MAVNAQQLMTMMGGFRQQKKSLNPFIDFNPMIYKKFMMMNKNDAETTSPIIDKANLGYPGLQEQVRILLESEGRYSPKEISYLVDYLLRNGLVSSNEYTLAKRILQDPLAASRLESLRSVLIKMFNKFMDFCLKDPQNYVRSRLMLVSAQAKKNRLRESLVESVYEAVLHRKTSKKLNIDDPDYRQIGTDSLTSIYRKMTPGMEIEENRHWRSGKVIVRRDSYKNRYRGKLARRFNRDNEEEDREEQMVKKDSERLKESDQTMDRIKNLMSKLMKKEKERMAVKKSQKYIDYPHDDHGLNKLDFSRLLKKESRELIEAAYSKSAVDKSIKGSKKKIGGKEAKKIHALLKGRQKEDEPKKNVNESLKAIVTKQNKDGSYDEVGMNNKTLIKGSEANIKKKAKAWANGKTHRIEFHHQDRFFYDPHKTIVVKEEAIQEGRRLVKTLTSDDGSRMVKVYRNPEWEEHVGELHIKDKDGKFKHRKAADYHADKEDVLSTAKHMLIDPKKSVKEEVQPAPSSSAFGQKPKKSMRAGEGKVSTNGTDTNVNKSDLGGKKTTKVKGMPKGISEDQVTELAKLCGNLERERNKYSQ